MPCLVPRTPRLQGDAGLYTITHNLLGVITMFNG